MISRRDFLGTTGCSVAGSLMTPVIGNDSKREFVDAHVHVWTTDFERYPFAKGFSKDRANPPKFSPDDLFTVCRPEGVSKIVLIQMSFYQFDNRYMLDVIAQYPGVFSGVAIVDETSADVGKTMVDLAGQGVRGFRLHANKEKVSKWIDSPGMATMWKTGANRKLAMCPLANADALPGIYEMCKRFPETPVVIDHFARIGVSGEVDPEELDQLLRFAEFENVYVKTSAFYALGKRKAPYTDLGPMIQKLRDRFGAKRLMWASDCPYQVQKDHTYNASISLIRDRLDFLSEEDKAWMLSGTAESVFFHS